MGARRLDVHGQAPGAGPEPLKLHPVVAGGPGQAGAVGALQVLERYVRARPVAQHGAAVARDAQCLAARLKLHGPRLADGRVRLLVEDVDVVLGPGGPAGQRG